MKRILFFVFAALSLSSCLDLDSGSRQQYTLIANFQYPTIKFRSDSTFVNAADTVGFSYDVLSFYHNLDASLTQLEGGFLLSCAHMPKSGNTDRLMKTYRALIPGGDSNGNIYTVYRQNPDKSLMPEHSVKFAPERPDIVLKDKACKISGCYLTNTVEVAEYVKANFKTGDKLVVKATGYRNGNKTGDTEIALADFSEKKDSIVSIWTPFELAKLGYVDYVDFEITSNDPNVPTYFCMDSMIAEIDVEY
ncbi:MAG: DUF4465 domain-containing protein [Bacteroidales bacterium]|nr:DUF4465 domain-containing protein [Bacteroidales bacterium]